MHIYRRGDKWWAVLHYVEDGKRKRVRRSTGVDYDPSAKARRAAEQAARDLQQSLALGVGRKARPVTLKQAVARMIAAQERGQRSQATIDVTLEKAAHLFDFFGPSKPAESITADDLKRYADARLGTEWREGRRVQPGTVHRELRTLRQALAAADVAPPQAPDLGRVYTPRERALPPHEVRALLLATPAERLPYVLLYLRLGVRKSELYKLGAVDWSGNRVRCRGTKTPGADRWIPMAPEVRAVLAEHGTSLPPWPNDDRELKRYAARAGIAQVSFNDLRRTFATEMAVHTPAHVLAKIMGTSVRMLERVYAQVMVDSEQDAIGRLSRLPCTACVPENADDSDTADASGAEELPK